MSIYVLHLTVLPPRHTLERISTGVRLFASVLKENLEGVCQADMQKKGTQALPFSKQFSPASSLSTATIVNSACFEEAANS